ncbi:hypothetical protein [Aureimonas sp. ME7]|uniref:hypothetical protein n=1 Tax=Aureimonas sp. ME7 TaxID=2744252 RepID=UPI0015F4A044|nr:hypothetical protein [Aureimonas sp. ME7]
MTTDLDLARIHAENGDRREGFEEFSAQIFHRHAVPTGSRYERYSGVGGDGGVEAIWRLPTGKVIGLQSKFFLPLKSGHLAQLEKSLDTALDNHPDLETYVVTLPFDPTPTIKARKGEGQSEKLETWRKSLIARASARGVKVEIEWWFASELKSRLLGMDNPQGRILYWFGTAHLSKAALSAAARVSEGVAGPRYSPKLKLGTDAGDTLKAFGLDRDWTATTAGWTARLQSTVGVWTDRPPRSHPAPAALIRAAMEEAATRFAAVEDLSFAEPDRVALLALAERTLPVARSLEAALKEEFDRTHGPGNDTAGWRQFQAAYQVRFPAADLDHAREACALLDDIVAFAESSMARAAGANILLMRGPAGIGKTHTTIDAVKEWASAGRAALALLGQEIGLGQEPWAVIADRLGIGAATTKAEVIGALSACAEGTGSPFVIMIDAVNETPERKRWQHWLPQLKVDLAETPIKLLLTCRDIFVDEALGAAGLDLVSFTHAGFAGREYGAAYAFAAFYKVGPPAEVVAQPEFGNPLFLHLVCRAAVSMNWERVPGGRVGLTKLITAILEGANGRAAALLDYDARFENPVHDGALALAHVMGQESTRVLPIARAQEILKGVWPSAAASRSLLRAMEEADLVALSLERGEHVLRFAFERLGDVLIAQASIDGQDRATVEARFLSGDLSPLFATSGKLAEHAGLVQAYSIVLPETFGVEIADLFVASPVDRELTSLALGVLAWRDIDSFGDTTWVLRLGSFADLVETLELVLAVAAVPDHPLNADWLDAQLREYLPIVRDALWTLTLKKARDRGGPGHQLVRIARTQDLEDMSQESAALLGVFLAWSTASADLLIRDEASHALTRLMSAQAVAAPLLDRFLGYDDDFIRERLLNSVYGVGLLRNDAAYWGVVADIVFDRLFSLSRPPENVTLRDLGRLIVKEGLAAGTMSRAFAPGVVDPPYASPWPLRLKFSDWNALMAAHPDLPLNLQLGARQAPDFARYRVQRGAEAFDLAAVGLTVANLNQWIVEQILAIGYDGSLKQALGYDGELVRQHGQERGVPNRHRRVSKKYEWIFLARLLGWLHDNVPRTTSSWDAPSAPTDLQAVELRTLDPTDLPQDGSAPMSHEVVGGFFDYGSPGSGASDPKGWVAGLSDSDDVGLIGEDWVLLAGQSRKRHSHRKTDPSLTERRFVRAMLVPERRMTELRKAYSRSIPMLDIPVMHKLYKGEFSESAAFRDHGGQWPLDSGEAGSSASVIVDRFDGPEIPTRPLWAPAPGLVASCGARWDGARTWIDGRSTPIAHHMGDDEDIALVFDRSRLVDYLTATKTTLVWIVSENRQASLASGLLSTGDRHGAWSWKGRRLSKVAEEAEVRHLDEEDGAS